MIDTTDLSQLDAPQLRKMVGSLRSTVVAKDREIALKQATIDKITLLEETIDADLAALQAELTYENQPTPEIARNVRLLEDVPTPWPIFVAGFDALYCSGYQAMQTGCIPSPRGNFMKCRHHLTVIRANQASACIRRGRKYPDRPSDLPTHLPDDDDQNSAWRAAAHLHSLQVEPRSGPCQGLSKGGLHFYDVELSLCPA